MSDMRRRDFITLLGGAVAHRWHTEAVGSSTQIRSLSPWYRTYRATAKSTSRIARKIQILTCITAGLPPFSPPESGSPPGGLTCASTSRVPPFDEYRFWNRPYQ